MIKAVLDRQLMISVNNDVGMLAAVTSVITSTGINLLANCAYAIDDKAAFMFVTDDNNISISLYKGDPKYDRTTESEREYRKSTIYPYGTRPG